MLPEVRPSSVALAPVVIEATCHTLSAVREAIYKGWPLPVKSKPLREMDKLSSERLTYFRERTNYPEKG